MTMFGKELTTEQLIGVIRTMGKNREGDDLFIAAALELADTAEDAIAYERNARHSLQAARDTEEQEETTIYIIREYNNLVLQLSESPNEKRIALATLRALERLQSIERGAKECRPTCKWYGVRHQKCATCRRNKNQKDNYEGKYRIKLGGADNG